MSRTSQTIFPRHTDIWAIKSDFSSTNAMYGREGKRPSHFYVGRLSHSSVWSLSWSLIIGSMVEEWWYQSVLASQSSLTASHPSALPPSPLSGWYPHACPMYPPTLAYQVRHPLLLLRPWKAAMQSKLLVCYICDPGGGREVVRAHVCCLVGGTDAASS